VELKDPGKGLGLSLVPISRVSFNKVRIPETNMIDTGKGGKNKIENLVVACSLGLSSLLVGTAQGAFDRALAHVKQRQQFGKKLVQFQITRHKLAAMATQIDMARLLVRRAAVALDTGKNKVKDCAMARLAAGRAAVEVCDEALQLFGGYGYIREYEIEAYYRDAKMLELLSGGPRAVKDTLADQIIK
jgi:alkylation response protein AidB-like acyl-CoA dehydrogenase